MAGMTSLALPVTPTGILSLGGSWEDSSWSCPGMELELWKLGVVSVLQSHWSPPPHSGFWKINTSGHVQGHQSC